MIDTGKISVTYKFPFFFPGKSTFAQMIIGLLVKGFLQRLAFKFAGFFEKTKRQTFV